ncbi:MAG: single-stranded-DNA-specific exonuclease RecJ [candidate division WWE3 bacterium]|nr:single-stranded-DNA-specific exonuclease RecJ [candidate division WWE3 bacterium]
MKSLPAKNWRVLNSCSSSSLADIKEALLKNRGLDDLRISTDFFADLTDVELDVLSVLSPNDLSAALALIKEAISSNLPIIIHGDYDVDGISATAILWETIYRGLRYKNCRPYIPNRFEDGYGLSSSSVVACGKLAESLGGTLRQAQGKLGLLITVDCGITAVKSVEEATELGFKVLVIDHHQKPENELPECQFLWSEKLCAGGLAYFLAQALLPGSTGLDLATLATIADLQPLTGLNRSLVKKGLVMLNKSSRIGLQALREVAGLRGKNLGVYEVGWALGPRLNASGRLETALDSLRLLCTTNETEAHDLALKLSEVNNLRQAKTAEMLSHAENLLVEKADSAVIVAGDSSYHEGVIGLVAGKLCQKYHRPTVVVSIGEEFSKGSARSITGFNIVEALRSASHLLENVGGHPAAAGFTIKTSNLPEFEQALQAYSKEILTEELLTPDLKVDLCLPLDVVAWELYDLVSQFEPFGLGNPEPVFCSNGVTVVDVRRMGSTNKHLSLMLRSNNSSFRAVGFGMGETEAELKPGAKVDVAYTLSKNEWQGRRSLELIVKDIKNVAIHL